MEITRWSLNLDAFSVALDNLRTPYAWDENLRCIFVHNVYKEYAAREIALSLIPLIQTMLKEDGTEDAAPESIGTCPYCRKRGKTVRITMAGKSLDEHLPGCKVGIICDAGEAIGSTYTRPDGTTVYHGVDEDIE